MFYHLKIAIRNLKRDGMFSIINIGGLAIGMAAAILILAWIYHEWSYDRFHKKEKQLYVAYNRAMQDGSCWDWTPVPLGTTLKADYPEIVGMARRSSVSEFLYANGEEARFKIPTAFTDPDFLTMFDFPLLHGNRETALDDPYSVVLTKKAAMRLFGKDNPMGQTILFNNQDLMKITGIIDDLPSNTHFYFDVLLPMAFRTIKGWNNESWGTNSVGTYVELHPDARLDMVNESIRDITNMHTDDAAATELFLYPLNKRHLYSKFENGVAVGGLIDSLRMFGAIAGLILLIASINFMNLSTARSRKRAKEVGVRKVIGSKRRSLVKMFLGESMIVSFIAGIIALVVALLVLPLFNMLIGKQISLNLTDIKFWLAGISFVLFTGLLAGSYPAFFLSSFRPMKVLKGVFGNKQSSVSSRKILVVVQFTAASVLIASTLLIHRQIQHAQNRDYGYNRDQLIYTTLINDSYELIKQDLLNSGTAISVTKTSAPMTEAWANTSNVVWRGKVTDEKLWYDLYYADAGWTKTMGATIIDGRDIDIHTYPTDSTALLLNETAMKIMNLEHPVGEVVKIMEKDWHVVGVFKDFILSSPYDPVKPMLLGGAGGWFEMMHIRLNGANRMADNLAKTESIFKSYHPVFPFEYKFLDEEYARKFQNEQRTGSLVTWFAGLTVFISCLGLFALVTFMAESRRKEIGIRKILGASVSDVMLLLTKEFLILVLISIAIALPVAWWIMEKWLSNYAYRTNITWWLFVMVGFMSLFIALLTVCFQAMKAATANPAQSIKNN